MSDEPKIDITPGAVELIELLVEKHGPVMFHQSGGCCDGSAPMCFTVGEFMLGARDVKLGVVAGCDFYIGGAQYARWKHTRLTLDVVEGRGASFSLEIPEGKRFIIRSDVCAV
jgi:uncharacterized protein (DUF779 family)